MENRIKQAVMASFVADALALGVHWVYRTSDIDDRYGRLETMVAPELASFHRGKENGAFTHYGDQAFALLESLSNNKGFHLPAFSRDWQALFTDYAGYVDGATKETLANLASGKSADTAGSGSSDLGGAARMTPLAAWYHDRSGEFIEACLAQTRMTHAHALAGAELFARVFLLVKDGMRPGQAVPDAADAMALPPDLRAKVDSALTTTDQDTRKTIAGFGQMCAVDAALPGAVHLIVKYETDLREALVENIMAGGDSAARGMMAGWILGLYNGTDDLPASWLSDMKRSKDIRMLLP